MFDEMKDVELYKGLPSQEDMEKWRDAVLILDDLMGSVCESKEIMSLFCIGSHHYNITTGFISQNSLRQLSSDHGRLNMAEAQLAFLRFLPLSRNPQCRQIIKHITRPQVDAICEVFYNLAYGSFDITPLRRHKRIIRLLGDRNPLWREKGSHSKKFHVVLKALKIVLT